MSRREDAAKRALEDIRYLLRDSRQENSTSDLSLSNEKLIELLKANFDKLDPDDNGISRDELVTALTRPHSFTADEYEMLRLITKYFDTIINLSDDEPGEDLRISRMDASVLEQFLLNSKFSLRELHMWCSLGDDPESFSGPPPLSSG